MEFQKAETFKFTETELLNWINTKPVENFKKIQSAICSSFEQNLKTDFSKNKEFVKALYKFIKNDKKRILKESKLSISQAKKSISNNKLLQDTFSDAKKSEYLL